MAQKSTFFMAHQCPYCMAPECPYCMAHERPYGMLRECPYRRAHDCQCYTTQERGFSQPPRTRIRDAIVRIREEGEPTFGAVNGPDRDNQARTIVRRLFDITNVTQRQFAALIGSPYRMNFTRWLNHPGDELIEGLRVIRFLYQILYEIADEALATELERKKDDDKEDDDGKNGAAPVIASVGEEVPIKAISEKKMDEVITAMGDLTAKDKKASVQVADPTDPQIK
ncbi:unnamed protein product [Adineta steineri]|nr:unnamed protein product [Adineta steineri]